LPFTFYLVATILRAVQSYANQAAAHSRVVGQFEGTSSEYNLQVADAKEQAQA
jgi:hypothetical protein